MGPEELWVEEKYSDSLIALMDLSLLLVHSNALPVGMRLLAISRLAPPVAPDTKLER